MRPKSEFPTILFIDPINSTSYYNFCFVDAISKSNCNFYFLTTPYIYDNKIIPPAGTQYEFFKISYFLSTTFKINKKFRQFLRGLEYPFNLIKVLLFMRNKKIDIVHFNYFIAPRIEYIYLSICKMLGYKIYITAHNPLPHNTEFRYQKIFKKLYHKASLIITLTEYVKNFIVLNFDFNAKSVYVIPHGNMNFIFNQVIEEKGKIYDKPVITFLGSISPYKGLMFLLDVLKIIRSMIDVYLLVKGYAEEDMNKYYRYAKDLGVYDKIIWEIWYDPLSNMYRKIINTSIFVFPYEDASQSGGIITAFTLLKPVIIRAVGGLPEMIDENRDGLIAKSREEMANKIIDLISDQNKYMKMKEFIMTETKKRMDWENIIPTFLNAYLNKRSTNDH